MLVAISSYPFIFYQPDKEEEREPTPEPEPELDEDDLPRIQSELRALQAEYDKSVVEKHKLSTELKSMNERMRAANDVLERCVHAIEDLNLALVCVLPLLAEKSLVY